MYDYTYQLVFNDTKYSRWYFDIINRAVERLKLIKGYHERHHIIPDCLFVNPSRSSSTHGILAGNPNNKENLVYLTAREHFLCHWLLTKCFNHPLFIAKMHKAFGGMANLKEKRNLSSRQYEVIKLVRGRGLVSKETRLKQSKARKGKPSHKKGKTYEEILGKEKADILKRQHSILMKGRKKPESYSMALSNRMMGKQIQLGRWWYNNGKVETTLPKDDPVPNGFSKGRLRKCSQ